MVDSPRLHPAYDKTFEEILEDVKTIKSDEQEGFVVNIDGHMIKVKH